jgi:peptidoglycan/xylan/chitin deacetylase (PgdA/CDA1 family)
MDRIVTVSRLAAAWVRYVLLSAGIALFAGCATAPGSGEGPAAAVAASDGVLARNDRLLIYVPQEKDTLALIAQRFLGSGERSWEIAEANGIVRARPGTPLVVPLKSVNPLGVRSDQLQTVPVLCYHRVGPGAGKMTVSAANFAAQLDWLADNGYHVIRLRDLQEFLAGKRALPRRSVVLTFDDGYESYYKHAYPLLRKHGFPATVFLYSDFVGAGDALTWPQMVEMSASGLIDIQSHSKTHANLIERQPAETEASYRARIENEARSPREQIERRLKRDVFAFAYPYGDANEFVLDAMTRNQYQLAVTVNYGFNPFYAQPLMLRRTMIYGSHDLDAFRERVQTSRMVSP